MQIFMIPQIVINCLQYRVAKMQTKSEVYAKYGHAIFFEKNMTTKTGYQ